MRLKRKEKTIHIFVIWQREKKIQVHTFIFITQLKIAEFGLKLTKTKKKTGFHFENLPKKREHLNIGAFYTHDSRRGGCFSTRLSRKCRDSSSIVNLCRLSTLSKSHIRILLISKIQIKSKGFEENFANRNEFTTFRQFSPSSEGNTGKDKYIRDGLEILKCCWLSRQLHNE